MLEAMLAATQIGTSVCGGAPQARVRSCGPGEGARSTALVTRPLPATGRSSCCPSAACPQLEGGAVKERGTLRSSHQTRQRGELRGRCRALRRVGCVRRLVHRGHRRRHGCMQKKVSRGNRRLSDFREPLFLNMGHHRANSTSTQTINTKKQLNEQKQEIDQQVTARRQQTLGDGR